MRQRTMEKHESYTEKSVVKDSSKDDSEPEAKRTTCQILQITVTTVCMGLVFGSTFAKSHVFEPLIIRKQFIFTNFIMLKMFLAAMGTGALCLAVLSRTCTKQFDDCRRAWESVTRTRGWLTGTITGTFVLGMGMAIAGACPGMVLSQVGSGVENSGLTVAGGLLGALIYGLLQQRIEVYWLRRGPQGPTKFVYFDKFINKPYHLFATSLGVGCILFAIILEILVDWRKDLPERLQSALASDICDPSSFNPLLCPALPSSACGILLGLLQIPAVLVIGTFLGSATSYQVCSSVWAIPFAKSVRKNFPYIASFASPSVAKWWQLGYCGFAIIGSFFWESLVGDFGKSPGVTPASSILGGFLMIFGARMAAGCTSGHGISGCAIGMIQSFIGVPAMFAGGIGVGVTWNFALTGYV